MTDEGGVNPGPIWPCLALFTPTVEAGNEATVASFGTPFTRTRWASWPRLWPWLASSGVARSGETFNSVAFGCISLHSFPNPHPALSERERGLRLRVNDVWEQCSNQRGYGVRGSCRWFGEVPPIHPYRGRMRGSRLHGNDGYEQCSNQRGYDVRGSCRWFGEGRRERRGQAG